MRHFFRNDNGEFDNSGYGAIGFLPRRLMDNFLLSFLADCIRIGDAFRKDALNNRPGFFIVATQHVLASHIPVYRNRFVVLIDDIAVGIAYRDGASYVFEIVFYFFHYPDFLNPTFLFCDSQQ